MEKDDFPFWLLAVTPYVLSESLEGIDQRRL